MSTPRHTPPHTPAATATPTLAELRCFEAAIRTRALSAAARELGVSMQAVSARMQGLERQLGLELLVRSPGGVSPTPDGEAVLAWAREVLAAAERLDEGVASLRGDAQRRALRVGASQTVAAHLIPRWLVALRRQQLDAGRTPGEIALRTANSTEIETMLRAGEIDLGFVECPDPPRGLGAARIGTDRMVAAVAPGHPWAELAHVTLAQLAAEHLITREEGSGTRAAFEAAVRDRCGTEPAEPAVSLATEAAVRSVVASGAGAAVLSELAVADDVRLGRLRAIPIGPDPLTRPFTAIWRGSRRDLTGARRELVALAARESG